MSDIFLKELWQDIKDPHWPDIELWDDFALLSGDIKSQAAHRGLYQRMAEINDADYWRPRSMQIDCYQKDRFVFVNVGKCGYQHHRDFFLHRLGWHHLPSEQLYHQKDIVMFGLMMHPLRRYLKGLTEFLWDQRISEQINIDRFMEYAFIPDNHSMPVSMQCGPYFKQIHWIPFADRSATQVKTLMNTLFQKYGSSLTVPLEHPALHESHYEKHMLFDSIKKSWETKHKSCYIIYQLHSTDLEFYQELVDSFRDDWSHFDINL